MKKFFRGFFAIFPDLPPRRIITLPLCEDKIEYMIAPVSFRDLNEFVDELLSIGEDGWEAVHVVKTYLNSPTAEYTTKDYLFKRKIS